MNSDILLFDLILNWKNINKMEEMEGESEGERGSPLRARMSSSHQDTTQ